eukprot:c21970_g1_i1 orf=210-1124(+)
MVSTIRLGGMLRQTVSRLLSPQSQSVSVVILPATYVVNRGIVTSKLFVGGLAYATDERSLREAFSSHGAVMEAKVIVDRDTGRSRGFGFVSFSSDDEAQKALQNMDGQLLDGRVIRVNYATNRPRDGMASGLRGFNQGFTLGESRFEQGGLGYGKSEYTQRGPGFSQDMPGYGVGGLSSGYSQESPGFTSGGIGAESETGFPPYGSLSSGIGRDNTSGSGKGDSWDDILGDIPSRSREENPSSSKHESFNSDNGGTLDNPLWSAPWSNPSKVGSAEGVKAGDWDDIDFLESASVNREPLDKDGA